MVIHFRRFALLSCVRFEKSIIQKCPCSKEEIKIRNCCAYSPKLRNYKLHHPSSIQILRNPILSSSCLAVEWLSLINMVLYKKNQFIRLFSFSRRLLGQYLTCFKNESDKKGKQITELPSKVQHISLKHLASQNSARFICKKMRTWSEMSTSIILRLNNWCKALFKNLTFSRQKKYGRYFIIASQ